MSVALFLQLCQILAALGGAGSAFVTIRRDLDARGFKPEDLLPDEHVATIKAELAKGVAMDSGDAAWNENHANNGN